MIRIGEVYCEACGDPFEPEGLPSFEGSNFCSEECQELHEENERVELNDIAYWEARKGGASVF